MNVVVAKYAGFCFGVNRAVNAVNKLIGEGKKVCTLRQIIHNKQVVDDFSSKGVLVANSVFEIPKGYVVVISSHGCTRQELSYIEKNNFDYVDTTCPFVKKVHKIVEANIDKKFLLVAGDSKHPEVLGICSYFNNKSYVFCDVEDLKNIVENNKIQNSEDVLVVSQTTFSNEKWLNCTNFIKKLFTNAMICDTICNVTNLRQKEAESLSKKSDLMLVAGSRNSSNTLKLYEICRKITNTIFVESKSDILGKPIYGCENVGIIAGASTPVDFVNDIKSILCERYM